VAIGRINGPMLFSNLERQGVNLAIDANLAYFDVNNRYVGISNENPAYTLDVNGNAHLGNLYILGNTITTDSGTKLNLGSADNLQITGGAPSYVLATDGEGNLNWANITALSGGSLFGNTIQIGANSTGQLVSNALTLTTSTTVTDSVALLNSVLGKLVPPAPPAFPGANTLVISSSTTSGLMCNFTQTDNSGWGNLSVAGGTAVSAVRSASYATSTNISAVGPGDSGVVTAFLNGANAGAVSLTGTSNGTYGNLIISNNQDYSVVRPTIAGGFWYSFDAKAAGTVPAGWNRVYIYDSATNTETNNATWYYDASSPGTPTFSGTGIVLSSNVVAYSSKVPHLTSSAGFTLTASVSKLSGDMYPNSVNLATGTSGGAFQAPATVTYAAAGVTTPLIQNLYVSSGSASISTTANIVASGFGSSSTGPSVSVNNSYATGSQTFSPGVTVLYKNGTGNQIEETSLTIGGSVGSGSGNPYRIDNPGSSDTPAYTGSESAFNSQTSTLQTYDATVVAAVLKHDQTNYSTGYLPVGPDLSSGRSGAQYFTFKFVRTTLSKFDIKYSGTIAGLWVALPGSTIDSTSSLNGWLDMSTAYAGSGIPGVNSPGNGSNGCALGGVAVLNSVQTNKSVTATFGTISSSSTATHEIYVRVKLTSGQSVTLLQIQTATN